MRAWFGWIAAASIVFVLGHWAGRGAAMRVDADASTAKSVAAAGAPTFRVEAAPAPPRPLRTTAPLPEGTFADVFAELTRRAEAGDAAAALELAKRYWQCRGVPESVVPAQIESAAERRADGSLRMLERLAPDAPTPPRDEVANLHFGRTLGLLQYCGDTPRDVDRRRALDALQRAAELGDADARLIYWSEAFDDAVLADAEALVGHKRLAAGFLRDALRGGDWRALAAVADVLERGHYADPDEQAAYAYWYAMQLAPAASRTTLPWLSQLADPDARSFAQERIAYLASRLTAKQIADAERLGRAVFEECCRG